jgi:hypothetical protein
MRLFLIIYDRHAGRLLELREFEPGERAQALAARFRRELDERRHPEIEVVLLAAPSLETLQRTHSRYFFGEDFPMAKAL